MLEWKLAISTTAPSTIPQSTSAQSAQAPALQRQRQRSPFFSAQPLRIRRKHTKLALGTHAPTRNPHAGTSSVRLPVHPALLSASAPRVRGLSRESAQLNVLVPIYVPGLHGSVHALSAWLQPPSYSPAPRPSLLVSSSALPSSPLMSMSEGPEFGFGVSESGSRGSCQRLRGGAGSGDAKADNDANDATDDEDDQSEYDNDKTARCRSSAPPHPFVAIASCAPPVDRNVPPYPGFSLPTPRPSYPHSQLDPNAQSAHVYLPTREFTSVSVSGGSRKRSRGAAGLDSGDPAGEYEYNGSKYPRIWAKDPASMRAARTRMNSQPVASGSGPGSSSHKSNKSNDQPDASGSSGGKRKQDKDEGEGAETEEPTGNGKKKRKQSDPPKKNTRIQTHSPYSRVGRRRGERQVLLPAPTPTPAVLVVAVAVAPSVAVVAPPVVVAALADSSTVPTAYPGPDIGNDSEGSTR